MIWTAVSLLGMNSSGTHQEFVATLPEFALLLHLLVLDDLLGQNVVFFHELPNIFHNIQIRNIRWAGETIYSLMIQVPFGDFSLVLGCIVLLEDERSISITIVLSWPFT